MTEALGGYEEIPPIDRLAASPIFGNLVSDQTWEELRLAGAELAAAPRDPSAVRVEYLDRAVPDMGKFPMLGVPVHAVADSLNLYGRLPGSPPGPFDEQDSMGVAIAAANLKRTYRTGAPEPTYSRPTLTPVEDRLARAGAAVLIERYGITEHPSLIVDSVRGVIASFGQYGNLEGSASAPMLAHSLQMLSRGSVQISQAVRAVSEYVTGEVFDPVASAVRTQAISVSPDTPAFFRNPQDVGTWPSGLSLDRSLERLTSQWQFVDRVASVLSPGNPIDGNAVIDALSRNGLIEANRSANGGRPIIKMSQRGRDLLTHMSQYRARRP